MVSEAAPMTAQKNDDLSVFMAVLLVCSNRLYRMNLPALVHEAWPKLSEGCAMFADEMPSWFIDPEPASAARGVAPPPGASA
jgi:hypothetical protein